MNHPAFLLEKTTGFSIKNYEPNCENNQPRRDKTNQKLPTALFNCLNRPHLLRENKFYAAKLTVYLHGVSSFRLP